MIVRSRIYEVAGDMNVGQTRCGPFVWWNPNFCRHTSRRVCRGPPMRRSRTVGQWHHIFEHQPREASPPAMQGWSPGNFRGKQGDFWVMPHTKSAAASWISGEESGAPIEAQRRLDAKPAVVVVVWVLILVGEIYSFMKGGSTIDYNYY